MKIIRRKSKVIKIGNIRIGGNNPVAVQSMVKTKTADIPVALKQIQTLKDAGCEIVRLAVKDAADARALKAIKKEAQLPIVADIHFHWRFALEAIDSGVDKIRLNPGNIYRLAEIRKIAQAARSARIPIRVGVNSGSVRGQGSPTDKMVESARGYIKILEKVRFHDIVVSLKGSDIFHTLEAYRKMARLCDYPLHLGVTATGPSSMGLVKSSIALGALLLEGIGDTIRISLTDTPLQEVKAAWAILEALRLRSRGPEIISCPTCGRCEVDLVKIVNDLENKLSTIDYRLSTRPFKVAIMGCVVNGPGEAAQADLGVAFGSKEGLLFKNGRAIKKVSLHNCVNALFKEIEGLNKK